MGSPFSFIIWTPNFTGEQKERQTELEETSMEKGVVVLVTYPQNAEPTADQFIQDLLKARLAACINATPVTSTYWWQGTIETDREFLLIIKTTEDRVPALEQWILTHHPYQVPEIVVLPVAFITKKYAEWLIHETRPQVE